MWVDRQTLYDHARIMSDYDWHAFYQLYPEATKKIKVLSLLKQQKNLLEKSTFDKSPAILVHLAEIEDALESIQGKSG